MPISARDVARGAGAVATIYALLHYVLPAAFGLDLVPLLNLTLASAAAALMNASDLPVTQSGVVLTFRGASVIVTDDCNSLGAWLLVVGAMWVLPSTGWRWRVAGMVASAVLISAVNIVRIAILCYLRAERPAWFAPFHEQIAPLAVVLTAFACVLVWMRRFEHAPAR